MVKSEIEKERKRERRKRENAFRLHGRNKATRGWVQIIYTIFFFTRQRYSLISCTRGHLYFRVNFSPRSNTTTNAVTSLYMYVYTYMYANMKRYSKFGSISVQRSLTQCVTYCIDYTYICIVREIFNNAGAFKFYP